ncbi:unnamed protein product [Spirodela intermedia]|uniref:WRKY19-like zinc finger domain-containing protein n=1 Tax=Spirodela intermedia TaxID=51605 RepID=A0A7I8LJA5_SPIIN|nr:unnamed protein product [Spirodela intermedia]
MNSFRPFGFPANFVKTQSEAAQYTETLFHPCSSDGSLSKGIKRKWDAISGKEVSVEAFPMLMRRSPSSSDNSKMSSATVCTISSARETDEESSMDLGLNFHLHLGNDSSLSPTGPSAMMTPGSLEVGPVCDLQLSLSTGPSQSVITAMTPFSDPSDKILEASVDFGSASCRPQPQLSFSGTSGSVLSHATAGGNGGSRLLSRAKAQISKEPASCSSGFTQQRPANTKVCQFHGCGKGARGASGLCIAHGGGRRCQKEGCPKGAEGRTVYCKAHGGGRRCQTLGCMKSAEGRTDYCIAHGGGRRCSHEGCTRAARGKSGLCIKHGGGKRCQRENCTKSAEGFSGLCIAHGGGRRCQYPDCTKGAQGSTMFCKAHGGGKRCSAPGCTKGAEGSTPFCKGHGGGKRCSFQGGGVCPKSVHGGTLFCVAHGGGKRCAAAQCTRSARGRTDFCVRHGGGKRCKSDGCGKSAQGRTDFCKAHGGGKPCAWGQPGCDLGAGGSPCERFARGKTGLCAAHAAQVPDRRVHGGGALGALVPLLRLQQANPEKMNPHAAAAAAVEEDEDAPTSSWNPLSPPPLPDFLSHPERRVHGGSLMSLLGDEPGPPPSKWV